MFGNENTAFGDKISFWLRIFVFPISLIPLLIEIIIQRFKDEWEVSPFILTGYFIFLAAFSSYALLYMNKLWWIFGAYIMTAMLIESLWKCVLISLGFQAIMYPRFKLFGYKIKRRDKRRRLLTPTALYMGAVAYGYTVYYFAFINLLIYKMAPFDSFHGVSDSCGIELLWRFVYYSAVTITTLGYGDIYPSSFFTQAATLFELAFGIFFVVFLFGTFISYHVNRIEKMSQNKNEIQSKKEI